MKAKDYGDHVDLAVRVYGQGKVGKIKRSEARVWKWMGIVHDGLIPVDEADDVVSASHQSGVRSDVFYLQGLLKLYRKSQAWVEGHFTKV